MADIPTVDPRINPAEAARIPDPVDRANVLKGLGLNALGASGSVPTPAIQRQTPLDMVKAAQTRESPEITTIQQHDQAAIDKADAAHAAQGAAPVLPDQKFEFKPPENSGLMAGLMMVIGALGGRKTMQPMTAALNNMTGMMQGLHKGDEEAYKRQKEEFDKNYQIAKDHVTNYYEASKRIDETMGYDLAKTKPAKEMLALEHGNAIDVAQAKAGMDKLEAEKAKADAEFTRYSTQIEETHRHNMAMEGGYSGALTDSELKLGVGAAKSSGDLTAAYKALGLSMRDKGAKEQLRSALADSGIDTSEMAFKKAELKSDSASLVDITKRVQNIELYTNNVENLKKQVVDGIAKINPNQFGQAINKPLNQLTQQFGDDEQLQRIHANIYALSREYAKAVTAAGSNAQMHVQHADQTDALLNYNMPLNQVSGAIKGMEDDIASMHKSAVEQKNKLHSDITGKNDSSGVNATAGKTLTYDPKTGSFH